MNDAAYLADALHLFRTTKGRCDRALAQVPFEQWSVRLDPESNSLTTLILHFAGNLISRWTDFLTADGEKPTRNRDTEFEDRPDWTQAQLLAHWETGWSRLFDALAPLRDGDLERTVYIRGEPHTVLKAIQRQVAHYSYHEGQLVFLAKHLAGPRWQTLSIARGQSQAFNAALEAKSREHR